MNNNYGYNKLVFVTYKCTHTLDSIDLHEIPCRLNYFGALNTLSERPFNLSTVVDLA